MTRTQLPRLAEPSKPANARVPSPTSAVLAHPISTTWSPRTKLPENLPKPSKNRPKGPESPTTRTVSECIRAPVQECNHRHYNGLDPRAWRQTPSRVWPSLARPRQRESVRRSPRSANVAQVARNNGPAAASCPSPIGPRPTLGRCRCRPRQQPSSPPTVLDGRACRYAVTTRRARAVSAGTPRFPPRPAAVFFLRRQGPPRPMSTETMEGAHRRNRRAVARSIARAEAIRGSPVGHEESAENPRRAAPHATCRSKRP